MGLEGDQDRFCGGDASANQAHERSAEIARLTNGALHSPACQTIIETDLRGLELTCRRRSRRGRFTRVF